MGLYSDYTIKHRGHYTWHAICIQWFSQLCTLYDSARHRHINDTLCRTRFYIYIDPGAVMNATYCFTVTDCVSVNDFCCKFEKYTAWWKMPKKDLAEMQDDVIKGKHFRVTGPLCGEFTGHRWISAVFQQFIQVKNKEINVLTSSSFVRRNNHAVLTSPHKGPFERNWKRLNLMASTMLLWLWGQAN